VKNLHIVCGLPASGKTVFAKQLAADLAAAFFDSDTATDLVIQAAHRAAGIDPHDRDSITYKTTYREPVYATLFSLAKDNLPHVNVVVAGPFTSELRTKEAWIKQLQAQFPDTVIKLHHLQISEQERLERMKKRGAPRDRAKIENEFP
jgi:predicted kinase